MKKILVLFLTVLLLTGCTKEEVKKEEPVVEKDTNLITETASTTEVPETEVVDYIDQVSTNVEELTNKENLTQTDKNTLSNTFKTLTDFIFYGGTIKGKTFNELTDSAKEKVISTWENIDSKIETKIPNYKEKIKETSTKTYSTVKEKATELKETIQNKYKDYVGEDAYNNTVETYEEDKSNLKEATDPYVSKAKEAYATAKEKVSSWYNNWKENN